MTMKSRRLLALFLTVCLGLSLLPAEGPRSSARAETYGKVINGNVRLRREATENSAYWFVLPEGWEGIHWYRVIAPHPEASDPRNARTYWGYISDEYFRPLTAEETATYQATGSAAAATAVPAGESAGTDTSAAPASSGSSAAAVGTTGSITSGGTNFREGASKKSHSLMKLDRGTVVNITSIPDGIGEEYWYGVSYAGQVGYVNSEFVRVLSGENASQVTVSPVATPTPLPEVPDNVMAVTLDPSAPTPEPVLRNGSRGQEVKDLQSRLYTLGYYSGEIDGQFGAGTQAAVIDFQRANGLDADGMVGAETKAILFSADAKPKTGE